ncbi:MAPEG family protein [Devosia sp.]|uniref:MAPEG family protein n=1 Tax=Devosia sp. TaxID=1871048 RepID=UPI0032676B3A
MTPGLTLLVWSTTLFAGYIGAQSLLYRFDYGVGYAATARDGERPPEKYAGRAARALRNLLETYAVFVALALAAELANRADGLTFWGGQLYFWARWVYLPLYVGGVPYVRSGVWCVSALGLVLMFLGVAF